jgi:predicted ATP-grasp superfamily ATP-dependent carboligase
MDLVRPLGLAGIRCAVVAAPGDLTRWSRHTVRTISWSDPWREPERLLERLLAFAESERVPPVLFYEGDWDLLMVSRERERLRPGFRFVIPEAELVEDLVDKERFGALAERLNLPVPPGRRIPSSASSDEDLGLGFPIVVKPLTRQNAEWTPLAGRAKALLVRTPAELRAVRARLADEGLEALAQRAVSGPETRIESYHAYVDESGAVAGEFTGRKLRTHPPGEGFTTALVTTREPDVVAAGRDILERLQFRGVAKLDFKRDVSGRLWLLEVNPRFNLWQHAGAKAGVNLPAVVYRDLNGLPRAPAQPARQGVRWVYHRHDARAARAAGIPLHRWLPWAIRSEAKSAIALDDPMPLVRGSVKAVRARFSRSGA